VARTLQRHGGERGCVGALDALECALRERGVVQLLARGADGEEEEARAVGRAGRCGEQRGAAARAVRGHSILALDEELNGRDARRVAARARARKKLHTQVCRRHFSSF
jgi:hypothetical protein